MIVWIVDNKFTISVERTHSLIVCSNLFCYENRATTYFNSIIASKTCKTQKLLKVLKLIYVLMATFILILEAQTSPYTHGFQTQEIHAWLCIRFSQGRHVMEFYGNK